MSIHWLRACLVALLIVRGDVLAGSHHGGGGHFEHHGGGPHGGGSTVFGFPGGGLMAVGGGWGWPGFSAYGGYGSAFPMTWMQPFPMFSPFVLPVMVDRGVMAGPMPMAAAQAPGAIAARARKADGPRSTQLVTIGDRLFRAGNYKRAFERYEQAVRADPDSAAPRVRLAQVALIRGQYSEAARQLRAAIDVEPGWLATAKDIQAIYAEPGDFTRLIGRLESHLLVEPGDRDAWLALGAELYLAGQTRRAGDVFLRLSDRKPDAALEAFLDATNPPEQVVRKAE